jgi:hypothetical protein
MGFEPAGNLELRRLTRTKSFDVDLTQAFLVAEALDHIENFYARQLPSLS